MFNVVNPARPFTKSDWYGFAGCTPFSKGDGCREPVIRCLNEDVMIVADKETVVAHIADNDNEWFLNIQFPTQALAMQFLNSFSVELSTASELDALGFNCL